MFEDFGRLRVVFYPISRYTLFEMPDRFGFFTHRNRGGERGWWELHLILVEFRWNVHGEHPLFPKNRRWFKHA
jgi:hypothetical protein